MSENLNIDISIRGARSFLRVLDNDVKAVSETSVLTHDLFQSITELAGPHVQRRETWFNIAGSNYTAVKYMSEGTEYMGIIVEMTPGRVPFTAYFPGSPEFFNTHWSDEDKKRLGIGYIPLESRHAERGSGTFNTLLDVPYCIMGIILRKVGEEFQVRDSAYAFADGPVINEDSEIYIIRMPNLHAADVWSSICWGTGLSEVQKMTLAGVIQLPKMFFDANFNLHLIDASWYIKALPQIAKLPDEPFKPFDYKTLGREFNARLIQARHLISHLAVRGN